MNRNSRSGAARRLPSLSIALLAAIGLWWVSADSDAVAQSADQVVVDYGALDSVAGAAPAAQPAGTPTSVLTKLGLDGQPVSSLQPTAPGAAPPDIAALTPPPEPVAIPNDVPMPEPTPPAPPPAAVAAPPAVVTAPSATAVDTPAPPVPAAPPAAASTEQLPAEEQAAVEPIEQQPVQEQYGEQPAQEQAAVAPPAEEQPAPQPPVEEQPAEDQAAVQQPAAEQPTEEQPAEEQPAEAEAPAEQEEAPAEAATEPAAEPAEAPAAEAEEAPAEEPTEEAAAEEPEEPDNSQAAAPVPVGGIRIVFPTELNDVPSEANAALDDLANQMLADESMRIEIMCYSSGDEETLDKARRKSLQRCLNVRQYLFRKNVRTTRMDVRALGLKSEGQPADRVDIIPANS